MRIKRKEYVKQLCEEAITELENIINTLNKKGEVFYLGTYHISALISIREELVQMSDILDSKLYKSTYSRYILDLEPPDNGKLSDMLINVNYQYNKYT